MTTNAPFIIWTFQRSGGTNLGEALFTSSSFIGVEHEPFNEGRVFDNVIKKWKKNKNIKMLYENIENIIIDKPLIKHCLEIMPDEINMALAEISLKHGYKHLFLYREEATSRLLSLNYSLKTKIWGKEHLKTRTFDKVVFDEEIPIKSLITHEQKCRRKMRALYDYFISEGANPLSVSFEMLYKSFFDYSSMLVNRLFIELIGSTESVTVAFLNRTLKKGAQGTNSDYMRFPNSESFIVELNKLPPFKLFKRHPVEYTVDLKLDITYMEIWDTLPSVYENEFVLQGILLCQLPFKLINLENDEVLNQVSGLSSKRILTMYPEIKGASICRFLTYPSQFIKPPKIEIIKA